jgi:hypothetical protein
MKTSYRSCDCGSTSLLELSVDASHLSETLVGPEDVIRRFFGVVGGVRSRAAAAPAAAVTTSARTSTEAHRMNMRLLSPLSRRTC